jgi:ribosome-binding protein aMBF1 (putative translation factor)
MSPDRMRWALEQIGWGQRELARRLAANESTIRAMARGNREIPIELAVWLETLASVHISLPKPAGWRNTGSGGTDD